MTWVWYRDTPDATAQELRAKLVAALQSPMDPKRAEEAERELADWIRNRHRTERGLPPIVERWDRNAPEHVVTVIEEVAA